MTPEELKAQEQAEFAQQTKNASQITRWICIGFVARRCGRACQLYAALHRVRAGLLCWFPAKSIWNVSHSLHTPLMAVTNAISGIVVLGALLQIGSDSGWVMWMAGASVLIATINIVGGFMVTRRMLAMFQKS